jgi:hypothetical protein
MSAEKNKTYKVTHTQTVWVLVYLLHAWLLSEPLVTSMTLLPGGFVFGRIRFNGVMGKTVAGVCNLCKTAKEMIQSYFFFYSFKQFALMYR